MSTNPSYPPILSSLLPNLLTHPSYPSSYEHLPLLPIPSTQPFHPSILTNFSYLSLLPTLLHIFPMSTYPSYPPILPLPPTQPSTYLSLKKQTFFTHLSSIFPTPLLPLLPIPSTYSSYPPSYTLFLHNHPTHPPIPPLYPPLITHLPRRVG